MEEIPKCLLDVAMKRGYDIVALSGDVFKDLPVYKFSKSTIPPGLKIGLPDLWIIKAGQPHELSFTEVKAIICSRKQIIL